MIIFNKCKFMILWNISQNIFLNIHKIKLVFIIQHIIMAESSTENPTTTIVAASTTMEVPPAAASAVAVEEATAASVDEDTTSGEEKLVDAAAAAFTTFSADDMVATDKIHASRCGAEKKPPGCGWAKCAGR